MENVQDRQDVPIWNAIEAKNYKQALKLVDKRLGKKATGYLEALKIYIRSLLPQASEKSAVLLHLEEVVARKPTISDLAAVELYEDALEEVLPGSRVNWIRIIGELRWQCVKAAPKDEDTSLLCLQMCLSRDDLDHARQIANSLEKNFPKNHSYVFWNITSMFMFSVSPQCPENQKQIWRGLTLGQINKLATATKQASNMKQLPLRSIQSPQELLLLDKITEAFGKPEQRLENLQDPHLGPESAVAKGEWGLWRLKLKLMAEAGQWKELFDLCGDMLKRARTPNKYNQLSQTSFSDWVVWEAYLKSASILGGHSYHDQVHAEVEAHLDPACAINKSWKRNASLAKVRLAFESITSLSQKGSLVDGSNDGSTRLNAVIEYLQGYGDASTAYNDLRPFVESLTPDERARLLSWLEENTSLEKPQQPIGPLNPESTSKVEAQALSSASQITRAINRLKLNYLIMSSIPEMERQESFTAKHGFKCICCTNECSSYCQLCLAKLAEESIKSYHTAVKDDGSITKSLLPTDRHPADDLCILASMCLIKLGLAQTQPKHEHLDNPKITFLLQATVLLESALSRSKSNFQISLMLVRLYSYLGCGSLAMRAYQRLYLKQIQLDTLSYVMFDRISTLHPHPINDSTIDSSKTRSLIELLQKQQKLYKTSREHINKNTWLSFKHGSYNSVLEFREVVQKLSHSMSATMSVVESNKIHRFATNRILENGITQMHALIPVEVQNLTAPLSDNNDYETFPNFESSRAPRFEQLSSFVPGPSEFRYRENLLAEKVMLIADPSPELSSEKETLQQSLQHHLDFQKENLDAKMGAKSMTRAERSATHAYHAMGYVLVESCNQELWTEGDFKARLETHNLDICERLREQAELIASLPHVVPAFQSTLNTIYTAYEVGRTALYFCKHLAGKGKAVHESQEEASKKITKAAEELVQTVIQKCTFIKKAIDDGGWIDKVLESVFPEAEAALNHDLPASLMETVKEVPDEVFMEEWAGEVVESWKDSIAGFLYIKMPSMT